MFINTRVNAKKNQNICNKLNFKADYLLIMNRIWVKSLITVIAIILFAIVGILGYLYFNQTAIKNYALNEINKQLITKLDVKEINLSVFEQFPMVSVELHDVFIIDPLNKKQKLLATKSIFIGFNLKDVLQKKYNIKQLTFNRGSLKLEIAKNGKTNFKILKTNQESGNFFLRLDKVILKEFTILYNDNQNKQYFDALINNLSLNGNLSNSEENLNCKGNLVINKYQAHEIVVIKEKPCNVDLSMNLNHHTNEYSFKKGDLELAKLNLFVTGNIKNNANDLVYDLKINSTETKIEDIISIIPANIKIPENISSSGTVYFNGFIQGKSNKTTNPNININFGIDGGKIEISNSLQLSNIHLDGEISNGKKQSFQTGLIHLKNLEFTIDKDKVKGDLTLSNFAHPYLNTNLIGQIETNNLIKLINNPIIENGNGRINFQIAFNGYIQNLTTKNWLKNDAKGSFNMNLDNLKIKGTTNPIEKLNADLMIANKDIQVNYIETQLNKTHLKLKGKILNGLPYLLSNDEKIKLMLTVTSNSINIADLILAPVKSDTKSQSVIKLPKNIAFESKIVMDKLIYENHLANNVIANIHWNESTVRISDFSCETLNGKINLDAQIDNADDGRFLITTNGKLNTIDITNLFKTNNNFGQNEITYNHLKGLVSGDFNIIGVWNDKLICDLNKLYVLSKLTVTNGELINYEPLSALSRFVNVNDLKDLKFANLSNTIEIKNKTIHIPQFDVKNNALNITLSGTHTFENFIDYKLKLKLSELLKNKRRNSKTQSNEFNEEEPTNDKGANLYLSMKGPANNFKITYDKVGTKQKIQQELKQEKQDIKEILKKELGIGNKNQTIKEKEKDDEELEFEAE